LDQLRYALAHPLTRDLDIDDPATTHLRRDILKSKPFLKQIYEEWYRLIVEHLPADSGKVVELGSGAGFLSEFAPDLITSEVFHCRGVKLVFDGQQMPFPDGRLRGIVMTNVMHHVPSVRALLQEAVRCLKPGGRIVAIEPWYSPWSHWVYRTLHHEPFDPESKEWSFAGQGALSSANGALPWIIFERDREVFEKEFPELKVTVVEGMMPFRYLVCGGISQRNVMPLFTFPIWRAFERMFAARKWAMFALLVIERR